MRVGVWEWVRAAVCVAPVGVWGKRLGERQAAAGGLEKGSCRMRPVPLFLSLSLNSLKYHSLATRHHWPSARGREGRARRWVAAELSTGRSGGRADELPPPEPLEDGEEESPPLDPPRPPFLAGAVAGRTSRVTSPPSDPNVARRGGPDDSMDARWWWAPPAPAPARRGVVDESKAPPAASAWRP